MAFFAVKRIIDGKSFLKDEDRIEAPNEDMAFAELVYGYITGKYDNTCVLDGIIVYEEEISDDAILDIIIANNHHKIYQDENERNDADAVGRISTTIQQTGK